MTASPSSTPGLGIRRGQDPYRQGDLDGLCGVYSVINAVSALCPELDDEKARSLFRKLIRALPSYVERPLGAVCHGMEEACVRQLLTVAQHDAEKRLKVHLKIRPYRRKPGRLSMPNFWQTLAEQIGPNQVAIAGLRGPCDHWTVVYQVSGRTMILLDSTDLRSLPRAKVTLQPARTRYRFDPEELVFLRRVD